MIDMSIKQTIRKMTGILPDRFMICVDYFRFFKKFPDLKNPKTFNEKLQWLKLHNRNPEHSRMVDKYEMKRYVTDRVGEGHVVPLYGVWDSFDEIPFERLPDQFVLKCTHDCGGLVICPDKENLNLKAARKKITDSLNRNYYLQFREWPYKNVKPRVIAEQYLTDESGTQLKDYKVFCFGGKPYCIQVDFDRFVKHKKNLYSLDWKLLDFSFNYPAYPDIEIAKPKALEKMLEIAKILSAGEPFVRIDFYSIENTVYVGEITFFPVSGYGRFVPDAYDRILGDMIDLEDSTWK